MFHNDGALPSTNQGQTCEVPDRSHTTCCAAITGLMEKVSNKMWVTFLKQEEVKMGCIVHVPAFKTVGLHSFT